MWKKYRNKNLSQAVMATALRSTYSGLFDTYPDAHRKDNEALRNYFSSHSDVGEAALNYMVATFKALTELADFGAEVPDLSGAGSGGERQVTGAEAGTDLTRKVRRIGEAGVTININVQLQIPDTDKAETYDNFFAALKKHLLS
jgi:hypothetical protein